MPTFPSDYELPYEQPLLSVLGFDGLQSAEAMGARSMTTPEDNTEDLSFVLEEALAICQEIQDMADQEQQMTSAHHGQQEQLLNIAKNAEQEQQPSSDKHSIEQEQDCQDKIVKSGDPTTAHDDRSEPATGRTISRETTQKFMVVTNVNKNVSPKTSTRRISAAKTA